VTLRVVVWDKTDLGRFRPGHDGTGGTARVRLGLSPAWWVGARLHAFARRLEGTELFSRGVASWQEAIQFAVACTSAAQTPLTELQVWGHGGWGFMDLGPTRLDRAALGAGAALAGPLDQLRDLLADDAQVWLRCCSAFGGRAGRAFAPALARRLNARVVGHTYVIGALQSGTHSLAAGAYPDWPLEEGVELEGGEPVRAKGSGPREPRTIGCLRLDLPAGF